MVTDTNPGLPFPRRLIAIVSLCCGGLMLMIDASIAAVALPTLAAELDIDKSQAVLVVTAYQLVLSMMLMPLAALGARIGLRRLYAMGFVLHSLAALLVFQSNDLTTLLCARALQGVGTAAAMSVTFGLVRLVYPASQLGKGLAINTVANASGTALAPVMGGFILSAHSWQWVFAAGVPFSILTLLFLRFLPNPEPEEQAFDRWGALLCAVTFGLIIGGFELWTHGPSVPLALAVVATGLIVGYFFVQHERRQANPVLPVDLLARPSLALALLSNFCAVLASMMLLLYMPFLLEHNYQYEPGQVGTMLAAYAIASVMFAPTSGYLSDRISVTLLCSVGMSLSAMGLLLLANLHEDPSRMDIMWRLWLCGAGFGMFFSPNARLMLSSAPQQRTAAAGSMLTTTRMLGQATGATLLAGLLALGFGEGATPLLCSVALVVVSGSICIMRWGFKLPGTA